MDLNILIFILIGLIVLAGSIFLLKSMVKAALLTVVIMLLFRAGWVYTTDEMVNTFHLDKILNRDSYQEFRLRYEDYKNRRDEDAIINPDGLEETIKNEIKDKVDDYLHTEPETED